MKNLFKIITLTTVAITGLNAETKKIKPVKETQWGGAYSKLSFGYGKADITHTVGGDEDRLGQGIKAGLDSNFLQSLSASFRMLGYDYKASDNFAIGIEGGILPVLPDADREDSVFLIKGELVPQISFINKGLKLFAGIGVGFANGNGYKGYPNFVSNSWEGENPGSLAEQDLFGGYYIAEVGIDYLFTQNFFMGFKYQYDRTMTHVDKTYDTDGVKKKVNCLVEQHNIHLSLGYKF